MIYGSLRKDISKNFLNDLTAFKLEIKKTPNVNFSQLLVKRNLSKRVNSGMSKVYSYAQANLGVISYLTYFSKFHS